MKALPGLGTDYFRGGLPDRLCAREQALMTALDEGQMPIGPVGGIGDELAFARSPRMCCHASALEKHFDAVVGDARLHGAPDQRMRHRVVPAVQLDVIVQMHLRLLPRPVLVRVRRQRFQRRALDRLEHRPTAALTLLERLGIEHGYSLGDRRVEFGQAEEDFLAQGREDPAFHHLHGALDDGLVARAAHARRQHAHAIVRGQILVGRVHVRIVAMRAHNSALQVVRDDRGRHRAEELERAHVRTEPVDWVFRGNVTTESGECDRSIRLNVTSESGRT